MITKRILFIVRIFPKYSYIRPPEYGQDPSDSNSPGPPKLLQLSIRDAVSNRHLPGQSPARPGTRWDFEAPSACALILEKSISEVICHVYDSMI